MYELLIENGERDAGDLIDLSGIKRPTVYKSLYSMEEKGIVVQEERGGKAYFRPQPPQKLLDLSKERLRQLEVARGDLTAVLPLLNSAFTLSTERPVVTTFSGTRGLKKIYEEMLRTAKPIHAVLYTGEVDPDLFEWLTTEFTRKRITAKIPVQSIVASGGWSEEYEKRNEAELRQTRLIDSKKFPIRHEIDIFGSKVSMIDFQKGGNLIGVLIDHPQIAASMKAWFDLTWSGLK